jgi:hypothetical protein
MPKSSAGPGRQATGNHERSRHLFGSQVMEATCSVQNCEYYDKFIYAGDGTANLLRLMIIQIPTGDRL